MSDKPKGIISAEALERLRAIFDPEQKIETDEDLLALAALTEDESDESVTYVDHDLDTGPIC